MNDRESKTIAEASTQDLIDELSARSRAIVLAHVPIGNKDGSYLTWRNGDFLLQLGLTEELRYMLRAAQRENRRSET